MFKQNICFEVWGGSSGKYRLKDKSGNPIENIPEDTCDRVSKALAEIESPDKQDVWFKAFKSIMGNKFAGGGRIMANAGARSHKKETSPINCTVMRQIPDSLAGIMDVLKDAAITLKAGCGVGYDFSTIRPTGSYVFGAGAATSGVISFMKIFDASCATIMSGGGRRGAQMGCLDVSHPEIESFITAKRQDGTLRYFNLSALVTDKFLNAVENDEKWDLWFWEKNTDLTLSDFSEKEVCIIRKDDIPYHHSEYNYFAFAENHNEVVWKNCSPLNVYVKKIFKTVKAKELFDLIMKSTYEFWEPGFILIDRINHENNLYFCETIRATNPCQPGWATLLTPNGIATMDNIKVGDTIWSGKQWTKVINKIATGTKDVYAFRTSVGTFYGTENHRVVSNGEKIEAKDAESIDISYKSNIDADFIFEEMSKCNLNDYRQNIMDGLVIGDGMVHKASNDKVVLLIGENDQYYLNSEIKNLIKEHRTGIKETAWDIKTNITSKELVKTYERKVPYRYKFGDFNTRRAFLKGLYSANGSVVANRVTLKAASFQIIEDVQQMLSSLGIPSYYTVNKSHKNKFENGEYECKESYDLNIGTKNGRTIFNDLIGFIQPYKNEKVIESLKVKTSNKSPKISYDIIEKEYISTEPVYDITVEADEHTYWTGGLHVSNCGEQPLHPLTSCLLGSMILPEYVENAFEKESLFNFRALFEDVLIASRALDNVVEINNLPLLEMQEEILNKRRHGLGITGLGSALNMLGLKYGSEASVELAEKISFTIARASLIANIGLAKEKGCAPIFKSKNNRHLVLESGYMKRLLNNLSESEKNEVVMDILEFGLRYSHATSIAPTGTMSLTWGNNCSNGIEPVFANSYLRNIRVPGKKTKVQEEIYDYSYFLWKEKFHDKKLPEYWSTTDMLEVSDHIRIQAAVQKWCDSSISKTINVPHDYSFDKFKNVYLEGWKLGLKGVTTYRPNAQIGAGVLTQKENLENTEYVFVLEDGTEVSFKGNETVEYDGEVHNVANLFDALKEGIYGNM